MGTPYWKGKQLYLGGLYAGEIMRVVPSYDWRKSNAPSEGDAEHVERNKAGMLKFYESHEAKPWRAWFMDTDEGNSIGFYASENEARVALEVHLTEAVNK